MPTPSADETHDDWMHRCVPVVLKDGTAKDQSQAVAICLSMWREKGKSMAQKSDITTVRDLLTQAATAAGAAGLKDYQDRIAGMAKDLPSGEFQMPEGRSQSGKSERKGTIDDVSAARETLARMMRDAQQLPRNLSGGKVDNLTRAIDDLLEEASDLEMYMRGPAPVGNDDSTMSDSRPLAAKGAGAHSVYR